MSNSQDTLDEVFEWAEDDVGPYPEWCKNPDVNVIARLARKHLHVAGWLEAKFFAQGGFNKVYKIDCTEGSYIMRIPLPLDPHYKLASEVATMALIRACTSIPMPRVIAFDDTSSNELGFEWILMDFVQGRTLDDAWSTLSWQAKIKLTEDIARYTEELFRIRGNGIGSIYTTANDCLPATQAKSSTSLWQQFERYLSSWSSNSRVRTRAQKRKTTYVQGYRLDRMVSMDFFWHLRGLCHSNRGPFQSTKDWLAARLKMTEYNSIEAKTQDLDQGGDIYGFYATNTGTLMNLLNRFTSTAALNRESFALHHHDLHDRNIMVNEAGEITALLDWESVSIVPSWQCTVSPKFVDKPDRTKQPSRGDYPRDREGEEVFLHHLQEFECSHLRRRFLQMMRKNREWAEVEGQCKDLLEFDFAVDMVDSASEADLVKEWIDDVQAGKQLWSLRNAGDDEYLGKQPLEPEPYRQIG